MAYPIEIILSRQWAEYLSIPVFLTDTEGNMLFYNQPAEEILGRPFEDRGPVPVGEWSRIFHPTDADGRPVDPKELPLVRTLRMQKPAEKRFYIESLQGDHYELFVMSFPLIGVSRRFVGAIAIFWKIEEE